MMKTIVVAAAAFFCVIGFMTSAVVSAMEIVPFDSANQNPLVQIYGLPGAGNALLLPEGRTELGLNAVVSSNHSVDDYPREYIILDGETTRFTLMARHGLLPRLEVGVKIPYISHGGGFLDGPIESFHSAFGLPQGGRDQAPRNRLLYRYQRNGADKVRVDNSGSGIGDIALTTAFQLYQKGGETRQGLALNLGLKLPTGDSDQLRGSGGTDIALWISGKTEGMLASGNMWGVYGSVGALYLTEGNVLPEQQKSWAGFGTLGLGWAPLSWLVLKAQADGHTPFFSDSDLDEIAVNALQLIAGGTIGFSEKTTLDIGISEDLNGKTSPDVGFYLTLRTRF